WGSGPGRGGWRWQRWRTGMTVTREQFDAGYTWDEWLEVLGDGGGRWRERFEAARLGELRAEYQAIPTPRHVLCIVDEDGVDSLGSVPYIARACDQAGVTGGVELRLVPASRHPELLQQYLTGGRGLTPVCLVFDRDWVQIGRWGPRPEPAEQLAKRRAGAVPGEALARELELWYENDAGRTTIREFLEVLRGKPVPPWQVSPSRREGLRRQAERAREQQM